MLASRVKHKVLEEPKQSGSISGGYNQTMFQLGIFRQTPVPVSARYFEQAEVNAAHFHHSLSIINHNLMLGALTLI